MSNTIRIRTTPNGGDKYLKLKVDQDFDFIEILSLKLTQEEAYRKFCSDYGAIVGRVIINSGFGVPNVKVSVFIPIDDIDKNNPLINGLYPYEVLSDRNSDGIRYNLLPKEVENGNDCFTPIGTFPTKREVLDNEVMTDIYCKYYKFTTTTNHAGDFMIFGVPLGTYTVHIDADISDIGVASQRPYDFISQGTPEKFFDSPTKFKYGTNLDNLVQVKSANAGVNVQPFWGDLENCEIGITRLDFDLNLNITPSAIFMGSIFGDQDKNSINKNCRPRVLSGDLCEQVAGQGSIEILRKTIDNEVEIFGVDGGRVIDDDGTWAFQVPMNLDYMVTDEFGNLILSQDSSIGVPTRASVRFRIGMDETGGEGRLRTRAKYLVPNNPQNINEIDYNFDEQTKNTSFRDLYWNKIYSVSNFISRYQNIGLNNVNSRNITAIKDVDGCVGDKTPFPFNRVATVTNPLFSIICLFIKIIGFLIYLLNAVTIPLINGIILIINGIISFINFLGANITPVGFIGCISVPCPSDNGALFAPGCSGGSLGFGASSPPPNFYGGGFGDLVGLDDCIAFELAQSLNLIKLDFYNDWINGTLFGFLLKYKKKNNGREGFCEYDCGDNAFINDPNYTGVDSNNNGTPDNDCDNHILLDTCYPFSNNFSQKESRQSSTIREGLIKKNNGEFYYAATTHNVGYKLFATDIICLGSVLDCDWQGFPKLQPYLTQTSYNIPPVVSETGFDCTGAPVILESGMLDIGGSSNGLFFSINCLGLQVNQRQALNIRHICEIGVSSDELIQDAINCVTISDADGTIGIDDIQDGVSRELRDSFLILNSGLTTPNSFSLTTPISSDFNINNSISYYNFAGVNDNGIDYLDFRGYPLNVDSSFQQPEHSFFMYFGVIPNRTALDKMNQRYFTKCIKPIKSDLYLSVTTIADSLDNLSGSFTFTFINGQGPFTYVITGPTSFTTISGSIAEDPANTNNSLPVVVSNLGSGTYVISGYDYLGNQVIQQVVITGPSPLYCSPTVTQTPSNSSLNGGQITITDIGGGIPPYSFTVTDYLGAPAGVPSNGLNVTAPIVIDGLVADNNIGYQVTVTDSNGGVCFTNGITINGPTQINLTGTQVDPLCYFGGDGEIHLTVSNYVGVLQVTTQGPAGYTSSSLNMINLNAGTYQTTVVDSNGSTAALNTTLTSTHPQLLLTMPSNAELIKQCNSNFYRVKFYASANPNTLGSTLYLEYRLDNNLSWIPLNIPYAGPSTLMNIDIPTSSASSAIYVRFTDTLARECYSNTLMFTTASMPVPTSNLSGNIAISGNGPYTFTVTSSGGIGSVSGTGIFTNNVAFYSTTLTDSVGCTVIAHYP